MKSDKTQTSQSSDWTEQAATTAQYNRNFVQNCALEFMSLFSRYEIIRKWTFTLRVSLCLDLQAHLGDNQAFQPCKHLHISLLSNQNHDQTWPTISLHFDEQGLLSKIIGNPLRPGIFTKKLQSSSSKTPLDPVTGKLDWKSISASLNQSKTHRAPGQSTWAGTKASRNTAQGWPAAEAG